MTPAAMIAPLLLDFLSSVLLSMLVSPRPRLSGAAAGESELRMPGLDEGRRGGGKGCSPRLNGRAKGAGAAIGAGTETGLRAGPAHQVQHQVQSVVIC